MVLAADNDLVADEAGALLRAAGWNVLGALAGGMAAWWAAGQDVAALELWPIERRRTHVGDPAVTIVDVREPEEWDDGVIAGAKLIPQSKLWAQHDELPCDGQIVTICGGGVRSARASSLLEHLGFTRAATVDRAGMAEWVKRGYPTVSVKG